MHTSSGGGGAPRAWGRQTADALLRASGTSRLSKEFLKQHCREENLYTTPDLNDQLYLQHLGLARMENLEEYTGLRTLWLEGNRVAAIENLETLAGLKALHLQHNRIAAIGNLHRQGALDTLNLAGNLVTSVAGLGPLRVLRTLNLAHNRVQTAAGLLGLLACPSLEAVDLGHNDLGAAAAGANLEAAEAAAAAAAAVLAVLGKMENLRVLTLAGNPVTQAVPNYRKTMIVACKNLECLDGRPILPKERVAAEAFMRGGKQAEHAARQAFAEAQREAFARGIPHLMEIQEQERRDKARGIVHGGGGGGQGGGANSLARARAQSCYECTH